MDGVFSEYKTEMCAHFQEGGDGECPDRYTCTFAHGTYELRRDPTKHAYSAILCDSISDGQRCDSGPSCDRAHNNVEYNWHPDRWRTKMCNYKVAGCRNFPYCSFAHTSEELKHGKTQRDHYQSARAPRSSTNGFAPSPVQESPGWMASPAPVPPAMSDTYAQVATAGYPQPMPLSAGYLNSFSPEREDTALLRAILMELRAIRHQLGTELGEVRRLMGGEDAGTLSGLQHMMRELMNTIKGND